MNDLKITNSLVFDYEDLMRSVDTTVVFTLKDVLDACENSKIPLPVLQQLLQCNYIKEFCDESKLPFAPDDDNIDFLRLSWIGDAHNFNDEVSYGNYWSFDGVGKKGRCGDDVKKYGGLTTEEIENYIENYAIEFTPIFKLYDYEIKINDIMYISRYGTTHEGKSSYNDEKITHKPRITLMELLYAIFYEISFCGGVADRNSKAADLKGTAEEIEKQITDGTLISEPLNL